MEVVVRGRPVAARAYPRAPEHEEKRKRRWSGETGSGDGASTRSTRWRARALAPARPPRLRFASTSFLFLPRVLSLSLVPVGAGSPAAAILSFLWIGCRNTSTQQRVVIRFCFSAMGRELEVPYAGFGCGGKKVVAAVLCLF
jgi:hypothetical protein